MYTNKQIVDNCFKGVILKQPSCYHDFRGYYWTVHKEANRLETTFNHDKVSVSHQNVLKVDEFFRLSTITQYTSP